MKIFSNQKSRTSLKSPKATRRAFTLIEMIVALGIFSVVAVVALGALVKIISANKKAQTLQASITNLNFALDAMSRDMSVGTNYYCGSGPTFSQQTLLSPTTCEVFSNSNGVDGAVIAFTSSKTDQNLMHDCNLIYAYQFFNETNGTFSLKKAQQSDCSVNNTYVFASIIDPSVTITGYYVKVNYDVNNNPYPLATIRISGYAGVREKEKTYFDVQTSISARFK